MSTHTIVTLPDGTTANLAGLATATVNACDGCGRREDKVPFIPATITIRPDSDNDGEGCTISAHLCNRPGCPLSDMARKFEAIWPLPEMTP